MSEKRTVYQQCQRAIQITQKLNQLENEINQLNMEIEQKKKFGCLWVVAFTYSVLMVVMGVAAILGYGLKGFTSMLFFFAIASPPIILLVLRLKRVNVCKAKIQELERNVAIIQGDSTLAWLPAEYRTGSCLNAIIGYVQNGRADSLKEALNLLEADMHRQRMEEAAVVGAYYGAQSGRY